MKKPSELTISFHGDKKIKEKYIKRVKDHAAADEIVKGQYWESGKGCAVGCTIHSNKHDDYQSELGISWRLALVEDGIFEKLPNDQAKKFPLQFLNAFKVGVDTELIFKKFVIWNLFDAKEGLIYHVKDKNAVELLKEIGGVYKDSLTETIANETFIKLDTKYRSAYAYDSSAYDYTYASVPAVASAVASALAYDLFNALVSAYAYTCASVLAYNLFNALVSAYDYTYASALAYNDWQKKLDERILRMRDKLLELIKAANPVTKIVTGK